MEATRSRPGPAPWPTPARAWFAVAALMIAYTSSFIDRQILNLLVEPIQADLGISDTQFSLLAGIAFSLFYTLMGLPLARLSDRSSRRIIIMVGIVVWSLMTVACGFANSFLGLFVARIGVGIGEAALSPAAYSLIADYFPPERRARAMGAYAMGPYLGAGLAMIIGGQVIDSLARMGPIEAFGLGGFAPWQLAFMIVGVPGILIAMLFLAVREPARRGLAASQARPGLTVFMWGRRKMFGLLIMGFSIFGIAAISYLAWMPALFIRSHGWTPGQVGLAYGSILLIFSAPGVFVGGWLTDRLTMRGRTDAPIRVAAWTLLGLTPFCIATPLLGNTDLVLVSLAAASFGFGMLNGLPGPALQLVAPNQLRAQVVAAYFLIGNLVSLGLGPTLVAWISDSLLGGPSNIGIALSIVAGAAAATAATLLGLSLRAFRDSVAAAQAWQGQHA
jgi:MFS family permease